MLGEAPDLPTAHVRCVGGQGPLPSPGASLLPRVAHGWGGLVTLRPPVAPGVGGRARGLLGGGQATVQRLLWSRPIQASAAWSTGGPGDTPAPWTGPRTGSVTGADQGPVPFFSPVSSDSGTLPCPRPPGLLSWGRLIVTHSRGMASWNQLWGPGGPCALGAGGSPQGLRRPQLWRVALGHHPRGSQGCAAGRFSPLSCVTLSFPSRRRGTRTGGQERMGCRTGVSWDTGGLVWVWWYTGPAEGREGLSPEGPRCMMGVGCLSCTSCSAGG